MQCDNVYVSNMTYDTLISFRKLLQVFTPRRWPWLCLLSLFPQPKLAYLNEVGIQNDIWCGVFMWCIHLYVFIYKIKWSLSIYKNERKWFNFFIAYITSFLFLGLFHYFNYFLNMFDSLNQWYLPFYNEKIKIFWLLFKLLDSIL